MARHLPVVLGGVAICAILAGCTVVLPSGVEPPVVGDPPAETAQPATPTISEQAVAFCEEEILKRLKAPATAKFITDAVPNDPANADAGPWAISGTVDSENGFGALIRMPFQCASTREGDVITTKVVHIDFEPVG